MINQPNNFYAGKISSCYNNWLEITSDKWILDIVKNGYQIEFDSDPRHNLQPKHITFSDWEKGIICNEVQKLLSKQVIWKVQKHEVKYLSSIFLRPKRDGSFRLILNLKKLNGNIDKIHFKMKTLKTLLTLVTQDCYFASTDLKDAYYSIPVHPDCQGWLAFYWDSNYYVFTALANGLSPAPRIYMKMLKPVFSTLRKEGHTNVTICNCHLYKLKSDTFSECQDKILDTVKLVDDLGFTIHPEKSVLFPTQEIVFVGFLINSVTMTVSLDPRKSK